MNRFGEIKQLYMNTIFSSCLENYNIEQDFNPQKSNLDVFHEPPLKYKVASALKIMDVGVKLWAQPRNKQKYSFKRYNLRFLSTKKSHIPFVYWANKNPSQSLIFVYCHGSGSTLNNVYNFAFSIFERHKIAVLAYDYTGDGESKMKFSSYEEDIKLILAWVVSKGYRLENTVLCGFSLGSYSALTLEGIMPRILISPVCGILTFLNGQAKRFNDQKYSTIQSALRHKSKALVLHCTDQLVHISHAQLLEEALKKQNQDEVSFYEITDRQYGHKSAPSFLCSKEGRSVLNSFLKLLYEQEKEKNMDQPTQKLLEQLENIVFYESEQPILEHLKEESKVTAE